MWSKGTRFRGFFSIGILRKKLNFCGGETRKLCTFRDFSTLENRFILEFSTCGKILDADKRNTLYSTIFCEKIMHLTLQIKKYIYFFYIIYRVFLLSASKILPYVKNSRITWFSRELKSRKVHSLRVSPLPKFNFFLKIITIEKI